MPKKKKPKFQVVRYQPGDEDRYGAPDSPTLTRNGFTYDLTSQAHVDALNADQPPPNADEQRAASKARVAAGT